MMPKPNASNRSFMALLITASALFGASLALSWYSNQPWLEALWQACQNGYQNISNFLPSPAVLIIPLLLSIMLIKAMLNVARQLYYSQRLGRVFLPYKTAPPEILSPLLAQQNISNKDIVFLNLQTPHAFCAGFLRPKIWLTAGMVNLLSADELAAVMAHEAYHLRQRDPLRLLISRTLKSAFFFLPVMRSLAETSELQQEVAADEWAIVHLGNDLPLLQALHKLLTQPSPALNIPPVTVNLFSVTEARLRRLINTPQPSRWRKQATRWLISLAVLAVLSFSIIVSAQKPVQATHIQHIAPCEIETVSGPENYLAFIN